jgi:hypothetical protein
MYVAESAFSGCRVRLALAAHAARGGVTHSAAHYGGLAIKGSWSVTLSRQMETHTLRTEPSDFSREPIVPGWI